MPSLGDDGALTQILFIIDKTIANIASALLKDSRLETCFYLVIIIYL